MKVRVFVGSSSEAVPVAEAVKSAFEPEYEVVLWNTNVFRPGEGYLDSLLRIAGRCNFGIFVFAPNDLLSSRGSDQSAVRDNVLFECGIFFGRLGRRRSFFLVPQNVEGLHLPSDLAGVAPAFYEQPKNTNDISNATKSIQNACMAIMEMIKEEMHEDNTISLKGTWMQTWSVKDTTFFPEENRAKADVLHIGSQFFATCDDAKFPFWVEGLVDGFFVTGTWGFKGRGLGYFGSFQLHVNPRGDKMKGMLVGFRDTGEIATGTWIWKRAG